MVHLIKCMVSLILVIAYCSVSNGKGNVLLKKVVKQPGSKYSHCCSRGSHIISCNQIVVNVDAIYGKEMYLWNGRNPPYVEAVERKGRREVAHYFEWYGKTFTAWTAPKKGLIYGIIRFNYDKDVYIISKCEGVNFLTRMDLSKLVDHIHE